MLLLTQILALILLACLLKISFWEASKPLVLGCTIGLLEWSGYRIFLNNDCDAPLKYWCSRNYEFWHATTYIKSSLFIGKRHYLHMHHDCVVIMFRNSFLYRTYWNPKIRCCFSAIVTINTWLFKCSLQACDPKEKERRELASIRGLWDVPWCLAGSFNVLRFPVDEQL